MNEWYFESVTGSQLLATFLRPYFPVGWIGLIAALAAILAVFAYQRAPVGSTLARNFQLFLRLLSIMILTMVLLGPSREVQQPQASTKPTLLLLADISESMLTENSDGQDRLQRMKSKWLTKDRLEKLVNDFQIQIFSFAEKSQLEYSIDPQFEPASDQSTFLMGTLQRALTLQKKVNRAERIVVLSDGIDSEQKSPQTVYNMSTSLKVPIDTVAFSSDSSVIDTSMVAMSMQEFLYPNELGTLLVQIYHSGCAGKRTKLTVRNDSETQEFDVLFEKNKPTEIRIPIKHEAPGQYSYQLELNGVPEETELRNNRQSAFVNVLPKRLRVLLLEGQPYWDTKFIAQTLRKDERIEMTQISQVNARNRQTIVTRREDAGGGRIPQTETEWGEYDVVILGREIENILSPESAKALVERLTTQGGNLVFARGRPFAFSPEGEKLAKVFEPVEPVEWKDDQIKAPKLAISFAGRTSQWFSVTSAGSNSDIDSIFEKLPGLDSCFAISKVKPGARVLATIKEDGSGTQNQTDETGKPAIILGSTGKASTLVIAGDGSWRWSLLSPENRDLIGFYDALWSNMIRYLVTGGDFQPGQQVSMSLSSSVVKTGKELAVEVQMKHASPSGELPKLTLIEPDGKTSDVPLQNLPSRFPRFKGIISNKQEGTHQLVLNSPGMSPAELNRKYNVFSLNLERLDTIAQPMVLQALSKQTGGKAYEEDDFELFLKNTQLAKEALKSPPRTEYIWDQGWILVLLGLLAGTEWLYRRLSNLI